MRPLPCFQMVMCATHAHHWPDLIKYKLLIIHTAHSAAWLECDLAFHKDAVATGTLDCSKMNLDLHNFHLWLPVPLTNPQSTIQGCVLQLPFPHQEKGGGGKGRSTEGRIIPTASCVQSVNSIDCSCSP